jgi:DNA-binding NtrC family response regulator
VKAKILVIDDEPNMLTLFKRFLGRHGYDVTGVGNVAEGAAALQEQVFDVIISDLALPDGTGMDLLKTAQTAQPHAPFILITAYGSIESAVEAMKLGAYDYISKPFQNEEMRMLVEKAIQHSDLDRQVRQLRKEVGRRYGFENIIGKSKAMVALFDLVERIAATNSTVLITGASGTGKELFAKAIHYNSDRRERPFVAVDCGVIPENLIESELFGHTKGAFTGAHAAKRGLFAEANTGTIFLDEVGNLPLPLQAKLLRVLQEREVKPVGSTENIRVDVRVIAATKEDLRKAVATRTFRDDLFYRLSVIPIRIPPLRERREDIPLLVDHFLRKVCRANKIKVKEIDPSVLNNLIAYDWPGNVRELENLIERLVLISPGDLIGADLLPPEISEQASNRKARVEETLSDRIADTEKEAILQALEKAGGNRTKAADILGISRAGLYNKLKEYGIN